MADIMNVGGERKAILLYLMSIKVMMCGNSVADY